MRYFMPTQIVFENGAIEKLSSYVGNKKAILITSEGFIKRGVVQNLQKNISFEAVFSDVKSHPEFKDLEKTYEQIHKIDFDVIVALGGGSVLDGAKFFSVYGEDKSAGFVTRLIKQNSKSGYKTKPIIAIPTTAGTGSEITPWATIWDMDEKKKYSLHLSELFSSVALYDPRLTLSVPKTITVQTGLDTLSHALESIWNKNANEITVGYAVKSAKIIMEYLPQLANDLDNLSYREQMMKACMYAGLAFSNTQTALAHAMSYYITAHKGVDHGIACSFTLPLLIDNVIGKYAFVDEALEAIFGEFSSDKLRVMLNKLGISTDFVDYGIDADEFEDLKASLSNNQRAGNSLVKI